MRILLLRHSQPISCQKSSPTSLSNPSSNSDASQSHGMLSSPGATPAKSCHWPCPDSSTVRTTTMRCGTQVCNQEPTSIPLQLTQAPVSCHHLFAISFIVECCNGQLLLTTDCCNVDSLSDSLRLPSNDQQVGSNLKTTQRICRVMFRI